MDVARNVGNCWYFPKRKKKKNLQSDMVFLNILKFVFFFVLFNVFSCFSLSYS
jgi:hypothetical protein